MSITTSSRILVIDDNRAVLESYFHFLEAEGYSVEVSTFSAITVQEIEQWNPALILIDLLIDQQLEQQAWRLMQQVEASHAAISTVFLICTASLLLSDYRAYLHEKQTPILFKPLKLEDLGRQVQHLLSR